MAKGKPTDKQIRYFAERMKGTPTKKEAALKAGYSKEVAENATVKVEGTVGYESLAEMLDTPEIRKKMQAVLSEGLEAKKPVVVDKAIEEYPDFAVRRQYVDTITDITGQKAKKELDVTTGGEPLRIIFDSDDKNGI
jgi:phage terminase small subunit